MAEQNQRSFDILLLIARPAAGKSEIIAHLKNTPLDQRLEKYHIAEFQELDDFPMLWTWHRVNLEYDKLLRDDPDYHQHKTLIIEFARGSSHGGFRRAFSHLSKKIADRLAILYIDVSWEESLRKNQARFNPDRPDSILEHGLSDKKMEALYKDSDWKEIQAAHPEVIQIQGLPVPYVVFENEDDITSQGGEALSRRLQEKLACLFERYLKK